MSTSKGKQVMMQEGETEAAEKLYVAVDKKVSESKKNLIWSLQNSGGKGVCILHVHQPAQNIPTPSTFHFSFPSNFSHLFPFCICIKYFSKKFFL